MYLKPRINIYICLKANKYVHWVNEWRFNIYCECRTLVIVLQTSLNTCLPKTRLYCLFFVYVSFREEKKDENTANAALNKTIFLSLPDVVDRCVNLSDIYMTRWENSSFDNFIHKLNSSAATQIRLLNLCVKCTNVARFIMSVHTQQTGLVGCKLMNIPLKNTNTDVNIVDDGLQIKASARPLLIRERIFILSYLLWHGTSTFAVLFNGYRITSSIFVACYKKDSEVSVWIVLDLNIWGIVNEPQHCVNENM